MSGRGLISEDLTVLYNIHCLKAAVPASAIRKGNQIDAPLKSISESSTGHSGKDVKKSW